MGMMIDKISWAELRHAIAVRLGTSEREVAPFLNALTDQVVAALKTDRQVRIGGLGTFKLQSIAPRRSINVVTGEAFTIEGYNKIVFAPEVGVKELIDSTAKPSAAVTDDSTPLRKLNEQAEEIVGLLSDLGQSPFAPTRKAEKTKQEEVTTTPVAATPATPSTEAKPVTATTVSTPVTSTVAAQVTTTTTPVTTPTTTVTPPVTTPVTPPVTTPVTPIVTPTTTIPTVAPVTTPTTPVSTPVTPPVTTPVTPVATPSVPVTPVTPVTPTPTPTTPSSPFTYKPYIPSAVPQTEEEEEEKKRHPGLWIFIILLLLLTGSGIYFYLHGEAKVWYGEAKTWVLQIKDRFAKNEGEVVQPAEDSTVIAQDTTAVVPEETTPLQRDYSQLITTIQMPKGKWLSQYARKYYGQTDYWVFIYEANRDVISNPHDIEPGTRLRIPKLTPELRDYNNPETQRIVQELKQQYK